MTRRDIPNIISMLRLLLVPPVILMLLDENYETALALFAVAGLSDALDGFLAQRFNWKSRLGSILDPVADKALLVSTYVTLVYLQLVPLWLVIAIVARDLVILTGALAYHFLIGKYEMSPSLLSKINTFGQIVLALTVVTAAHFAAVSMGFIDVLIYAVAATTVLSGASYVWSWSLQALRARSRSHYG